MKMRNMMMYGLVAIGAVGTYVMLNKNMQNKACKVIDDMLKEAEELINMGN